MTKFVLHDQGEDAVDCRYSLQTESGEVVLMFNTVFLGISAKEVERVFNAHHFMLKKLEGISRLSRADLMSKSFQLNSIWGQAEDAIDDVKKGEF